MLFDILALISTLIIITLLKRLVNIFPSLVACMMRWKESINLEASVKHSLDRDMLAVAMIIPFCLAAERFRMYDPAFMDGMNENSRLGITIGVFFIYFLIRMTAFRAARPHKMSQKTYQAAGKAAYTFFITLTLLVTGAGSILSFFGAEADTVTVAMLWISACIYAVFLLRKMQIFVSCCSFFTAFLYLCALEFLPTGVLVASALIL